MKAKRVLPLAIKFLVCDEIRREASGKLLMVGFYPGEIVILNEAIPDKARKTVGAAQSIAMVFVASQGVGEFDGRLKIVAPNNMTVFDQSVGTVALEVNKTATVAAIIRPFPVFAFGEHNVSLFLDEKVFTFSCEIRDGSSLGKTQLTRPKNRTKKAKRK